MSDIDFDFGELNTLAADLADAPRKVFPRVRQAVEVTARDIKDDWRGYAKERSGRHAKSYPNSIDYTMELNTDAEISAQIGPNLGRKQGALGILEDAPGGVRAAPQRAGQRAERDNLSNFELGLLKAMEADDL